MRTMCQLCLILIVAAAFTGCARKQFTRGGCGGGCTDGCCGGGGMTAGRKISDRAYGQTIGAEAACQACGGRGMFGGRGCGACGGSGAGCGCHPQLASGFRGGLCNDEFKQTQPPFGPQGAQVAYPYYTTRGPRDFLVDNPPSIGY